MSFIQFESARDKERARQDLREAREHILEVAKKRVEQRAERDAERCLKGEIDWMLPSVKEKLIKKSKEHKKLKKTKFKKRSKTSKKKSHKKRKHSSSDDECEPSADESSSSDSDKRRSSKKSKKKKSHKKRKRSISGSESSDTSSSTDDNENSETKKHKSAKKSKRHGKNSAKNNVTKCDDSPSDKVKILENLENPLKRDSWMTEGLMLKTYSRERVENKPKENKQIVAYDPAKSSRELNPYWKTTGTGLPTFQRPKDEDDNECTKSAFSQRSMGTKGWRKRDEILQSQNNKSTAIEDETSNSDSDTDKEIIAKPGTSASEFLTDQQMNELGAKILKAEIMGNMKVADELREKLEKARIQRSIFKERKKSEYLEGNICNVQKQKGEKCKQDEHVLLTETDQQGNTRPLLASKAVDHRKMTGREKKRKQNRVSTHDDSGQRVRYFADDDRYDIKQMFEREKYTSAADDNLQFANIAGKHKNPNDDLEDIFAEKISQDDSARSEHRERNRAIREHQRIEKSLDNCERCFESTKMQKELLICMGEKVYLSLPWYQGLQPGHCMIVPNQHATCCSHIDEDTWSEITDFRKSLTRMFAAQHKDVIFFEIANKFHRRPHLVIHCIPIKESEAEMAPFYFKKAIEESEHEWCVNKQLVSLRNKSLRSSIPKGLPYFWVNFGMDSGFAHVMEDESRFPANFAQEIIGGMLHLDPSKWRTQHKEQNIISKVKMFAEWWKKYDCTT